MTRTASAPRTTGRGARPLLLGGLAVVMALIMVALGHRPASSALAESGSKPSSLAPPSGPPTPRSAPTRHGSQPPAPVGAADGVVPDGVTVFDDTFPAVTKLDPDLLAALRRAATRAGDEGITFYVSSGWRSPRYQNQLLHEAISTYGSQAAAARWVATPATSAHVSGDAVDVARSDATAWLSRQGARFGLCQIYRNEPWHYELRPQAVAHGCPPMYANPTQDPRMQR